jgi:GMP synthase-like glutamine amidotransferase
VKFAVIDNYKLTMPEKRRSGFDAALAAQDYDYVRYDQIGSRDLNDCCGIILSGSEFDLTGPKNSFDREVYERMIPEFELLQRFTRPVLGICFGHQLMAIAEEFDRSRTAFGDLKIALTKEREQHRVREVNSTINWERCQAEL